MSYDSDHDFRWFFDALSPRGQVPGDAIQTLPHIVLDAIRPTVDALGWQRYADSTAIGVVNTAVANTTDINGPATASGFLRFYYAATVIHEAVATTHDLWVEINDPALAFSIPIIPALLAVGSNTPNAIVRPALVRTGSNLRGKAEPTTGVGENLRLRAFFIDLPVSEYIPPR